VRNHPDRVFDHVAAIVFFGDDPIRFVPMIRSNGLGGPLMRRISIGQVLVSMAQLVRQFRGADGRNF
jgi:hypothetical protein